MSDLAVQASPAEQWNRFWFEPASLSRLAWIRVVAALGALWYFGNFAADIGAWFGEDGRLSVSTTTHLTGGESLTLPSPLRWTTSGAVVTSLPWIGAALALTLAAGVAARWTAPLTLACFLFHVNRGPMLTGLLELPLAMLLLYVCLEPASGHVVWRREGADRGESEDRSVLGRVAWRLAQLHLCGLLLTMGLNMLGNSEVWWNGEASWWLISSNQTRLIDLTFLHSHQLITNAITHAGVAYCLIFAPLIWRPLLRIWILRAGLVWWAFVAVTTGCVGFSALIVGAAWALFPNTEQAT